MVRAELTDSRVAKRNVASPATLGRSDVALPDVTPHRQPACAQVNVTPAQRQQFALSQTCFQSKRDHRSPLGLRPCKQVVSLPEAEEVDLWLRHTHPLDRRHGR